MTPSSYMFEQLSWLPIPKRFMYNKEVFACKALNNLTPAYILNVSEKLPVNHMHLNIGQYLVHSERKTAETSTLNFMT